MDTLELNAFPAVAANATSTLTTSELVDKTLHALVFELGGTTFNKTHISNIRVRVDGKDIIDGITGAQLLDLNEYDGITDVTDYLILPFGDPTANTFRGKHLGDIDFSIYRHPIEIEVAIGAATAPTLKVYARAFSVGKVDLNAGFSPVEAASFRALVRSVIQTSAAVTRQSVGVSIGSSAGARLRRVSMFHANLTSVDFRKGSLVKQDDISAALNNAIGVFAGRVNQSGLYPLDFVVNGDQGESEMTVKPDGTPWNLKLAITTSNADTITAFSDILTTHPQL